MEKCCGEPYFVMIDNGRLPSGKPTWWPLETPSCFQMIYQSWESPLPGQNCYLINDLPMILDDLPRAWSKLKIQQMVIVTHQSPSTMVAAWKHNKERHEQLMTKGNNGAALGIHRTLSSCTWSWCQESQSEYLSSTTGMAMKESTSKRSLTKQQQGTCKPLGAHSGLHLRMHS